MPDVADAVIARFTFKDVPAGEIGPGLRGQLRSQLIGQDAMVTTTGGTS